MIGSTFTTIFRAAPPIPLITADLVQGIADHIEEAIAHPEPVEEGVWHEGDEFFIMLDDETVNRIRESTGHISLLYVRQLDTDDQGDLILTAYLPE